MQKDTLKMLANAQLASISIGLKYPHLDLWERVSMVERINCGQNHTFNDCDVHVLLLYVRELRRNTLL